MGDLYVHVIDPKESGEFGAVGLLMTHDLDFLFWEDCGAVCPPGLLCVAFNAQGERCGKREAVVHLDARIKGSRVGSEATNHLALCGGHLAVHRSGKPVRVAMTFARGTSRRRPW